MPDETPSIAPVVNVPTSTASTKKISGDVNRATAPEVYDPKLRTFITKPENKVCPSCGQIVQAPIKLMRNVMNKYVNPVTNAAVVLNDDAPEITINGVVLKKV